MVKIDSEKLDEFIGIGGDQAEGYQPTNHDRLNPYVLEELIGIYLRGNMPGSGELIVTTKGKAYLDMVAQVPFPVTRWADPRDDPWNE